MTLFDHYLEYMTQLMEGRRTPPEGITLPEGDMTEKVASLSRQLQQYSWPPYRWLPRRRSPPRRPRIPMQASTPSRCFWTAWRWMTVWCST